MNLYNLQNEKEDTSTAVYKKLKNVKSVRVAVNCLKINETRKRGLKNIVKSPRLSLLLYFIILNYNLN